MKKILSLLLICALVLTALALTACNKQEDKEEDVTTTAAVEDDVPMTPPEDPVETLEVKASDDKYRNFYHIWVCSFNDTNGDETGDLNGITEKLDYLNDGDPNTTTDLGVDGIWLSPIMPSDSYHKYDVDDYMDIDPEFGTLEDFDRLIEECDKRGITVILDLVLNHCGTGHEFYKQAMTEAKSGNLSGYADYYRFTNSTNFPGEGWRSVMGTADLWYEGQFSSEMPEWNLASQKTRDYFEEVAKFWLERGVGGFRLDAVKYMTDETTDGAEFLGWFYSTAQKYNPDVYMVGENWQSNSYLYEIYESGIDSQFAFSFATASGNVATAVNSGVGNTLAAQLKKFDDSSVDSNENVIHAMFISNHDTIRSANYFSGDLSKEKMAAAVYLLLPGNSFTYYGEELGLEVPPANTGNDAYFRSAMPWDSDVEPDIWCTASAYAINDKGGVKQQQEDENSLLNFYKRVIRIKNQNPEIARGRVTETYTFDNVSICAYKVEYEGKSLLIVHNLDAENPAKLTITEDMIASAQVRGTLVAAGEEGQSSYVTLSENTLTMPARSSVVIGSAN